MVVIIIALSALYPWRGEKSRSDSIANVVKNAERLATEGVKEIVLTGVNLGDFSQLIPQRGI